MNLIGMCGAAGSGKDTVADILVRDHGFVKIALADPMKRFCKEVFGFTDDQMWGPSSERNRPDPRFPQHVKSHALKAGVYPYRCIGCGKSAEGVTPRTFDAWAEGPCLKGYLTPREALQQLGTEWGRRMYEDVWIKYALQTTEQILSFVKGYAPETGLFTMPSLLPRGYHFLKPKGVVLSDVRFPNELAAIRAAGGRVWKTTHGHGLAGAAGAHESERYVGEMEVDALVPEASLEALPVIVTSLLKGG